MALAVAQGNKQPHIIAVVHVSLSRYEKIEYVLFRCKPLWFHQNGCLKVDHLDEAKTEPHHLRLNLTQPFQNNSITLSKNTTLVGFSYLIVYIILNQGHECSSTPLTASTDGKFIKASIISLTTNEFLLSFLKVL